MIAAQQGHGDTGKAVVGRKAIIVAIAIAEHFIDADHPSEGTGNRHSNDDLFANRDAAILCRSWISPGCTQLVTPFSSPQEKINQHATDKSQYESKVERYSHRKSRN